MSVCGQSGLLEDDGVSEEISAAVREKPSDIYKQKPASKVVRVLTVLAYLLSVSLAAILLSVYYMCVWKSPDLPYSETAARRSDRYDFGTVVDHTPLHIIGGGDTTVNGSTISPPENSTSGYTNVSEDDSTTETAAQNTTVFETTTQGPRNDTSDDIGTQSIIDSVT